MAQFTASPIAMLLVSVLLGTVGQMMLKTGINQVALGSAAGQVARRTTEVGVPALVAALKAIPNPWVLAGFLSYGVSSILWLMILRRVPLSTAYPMISVSYVLVVILSAAILKEQVRWPAVVGLVLIVAGVTLIGMGMDRPGGR